MKKILGRPCKGSGEVYEWRIRENLTQAEAAQKLKCNLSTIQRCESRGTLPAKNTVAYQLLKKHAAKPLRSLHYAG